MDRFYPRDIKSIRVNIAYMGLSELLLAEELERSRPYGTICFGRILRLRVEIVKQPDGAGVLRCTRHDDSVTWQKQTKHAAYFALHDLTHYAVEATLGYRRGFFGLIAAGWDVEDTTGKGTRGALPSEAVEVEQIVGLFQTEEASGTLWTAEQFNEFTPRTLTEAEIQNVRTLRATLFQKWFATRPGDKLELEFELTGPESA